jgi:uncharacterized protein YyaL (SSP411 family)
MHSNRLQQEKSPYLLQHAHNPVDWYPWGSEAFERARSEDKPIFLSVGYSTCHWCHVMERESFENDEIARILNQHFVSIKVDREERPDVDRVYMTYVQATTGSGGWPMSVWLTPDLRPFVGGTYFPPDSRYGRPGFAAVLEHIARLWQDDRERIETSSRQVLDEIKRQTQVNQSNIVAGKDAMQSGFWALRRSFDSRLGGFGSAPKFPRPVALNFLLRYWAATGNSEALEMTVKTLDAMADGGMNDQLGGGFHRYSVDARWFVPHFEKMLYDQAQLATSYLEVYQITGQEKMAETARATLDYVLRDMTSPEGGFYSAEDADSVIDPAKPHEKGEGAFYIWPEAEIEEIVGQPAAKYVAYRFGVERDGNVREDPHGEFTGKNIFYVARSLEDVAEYFDKPVGVVSLEIKSAAAKLFAERSKRIRPHLDDKILTAWNGLMISAFAKAGAILREPRYRDAAVRAAEFVLSRLYRSDEGILLRRFRDGEAAIEGFADDYAFFVQALLDLYETVFDDRYLELAIRLTRKQMALFEDTAEGGFFSSAENDPTLVLRMKEDYDGAEPAGNSVTALNLARLDAMTGDPVYRASLDRLFRAFAQRLAGAAVTIQQMLVAFDFASRKPAQIVFAPGDGFEPLVQTMWSKFLPGRVALAARERTISLLGPAAAALNDMKAIDGRAAAYVCQDFTCQLPVTETAGLEQLLQ